ncbi:jg15267, partial [Pararge aegeria aegeria]
DSRREGSTDEPSAPDVDVDTSDATVKEPEKETK